MEPEIYSTDQTAQHVTMPVRPFRAASNMPHVQTDMARDGKHPYFEYIPTKSWLLSVRITNFSITQLCLLYSVLRPMYSLLQPMYSVLWSLYSALQPLHHVLRPL